MDFIMISIREFSNKSSIPSAVTQFRITELSTVRKIKENKYRGLMKHRRDGTVPKGNNILFIIPRKAECF